MGWQMPEGEHWRGDIGRMRLEDDGCLQIDPPVAILSRGSVDPVSLSYPWILQDPNGMFRMWYGSTVTWDAGNDEMLHVINYAVSSDGMTWDRKGASVPYEIGKAQAFSHPTVILDSNERYHMWFSYRSGTGQTYRIGYADSDDGENWELRLNRADLDVSESGWDSEMVEYPFVFDHNGKRYMLYNGNGYGKTGFGLAVWEDD